MVEVHALASDFSANDYVVVFAGYNDFCKGKCPNVSNILSSLKKCIHTNIVILSVPVSYKFTNMCFNFNKRLLNLVNKFDKFSSNKVCFLDSCNVMGRKHKNVEISRQIRNAILLTNCKTLTYIEPNESFNNSDLFGFDNVASNNVCVSLESELMSEVENVNFLDVSRAQRVLS